MKRLLCIVFCVMISGCFLVDSNTNDEDKEDGYQYKFKDQIAQGKILGQNWKFTAGCAKQSGYDNDEMLVELFEVVPKGDTCSFGGFNNSKYNVSFYVKKAKGVHELGLSTQVMFTGNKVTSLGAVEILIFDEDKGTVSGSIDAYCDDSTNVNGTFQVKYCD